MHDPHLHLLVDDHEIQQYKNLLRILNRPKKLQAPVIRPDQPWEATQRIQAWGSVIRDPDGTFRCWYYSMDNPVFDPGQATRGGYGYAESSDGIHWEKPSLGLIEFRGSKENNMFYTFAPDKVQNGDYHLAKQRSGIPTFDEEGNELGLANHMDGFTVVRDEVDPDPEKRYKLFGNMQNHLMWNQQDRYPGLTDEEALAALNVFGQYIDTSPDGIHWTHKPRRFSPAPYGDYMMVTWDERNQQWLLNERTLGLFGRNAGIRASRDLTNWPETTPMCFAPGPDTTFGRQAEWHAGMTPFNYGNMDLGLLERWSNEGLGKGCELISHRDGQDWHRVEPGRMFLDTGPENSFDKGLAYPTHNPPIRMGDKLHIYYTSGGPRPSAICDTPMGIGLATLGVDRFAGLAHARGETGELLTKPMVIPTPHLSLNIEALVNADVRLAIRAPDGSFIPGYELDQSEIDLYNDPYRCAAKWKTKPDLAELVGREIWLHFQIRGASLYSYRTDFEG